MAWYSVLPSHLTVYETWIIRTFIVLAIVNLLPWVSLITYDLILYITRTIYYEIPVYGGRAQGRRRPRVPSLTDRTRNRRMSFAEMIMHSSAEEEEDLSGRRVVQRQQQHRRSPAGSRDGVIPEEEEESGGVK